MRQSKWVIVAGTALAGLVSACATETTAPPTLTPVPPTLTPAPTVGLVVAVTDVPTVSAAPTPHPSPTPFHRPAGVYLIAAPSSGPPASRTIVVLGGHFPTRIPIDVVWAPVRLGGSVSASANTDGSGQVSIHFVIPAAQPGAYRITAYSSGLALASAVYRVVSRATIAVDAQPASGGDMLKVRGRAFLPNTHLVLVAYPLFRGQKLLVLGKVTTGHGGKFIRTYQTRKLAPGSYELRAYSSETAVAQTVSTYFQVEV